MRCGSNGSVRGLVLIAAVRRYQHRCHHRKGSECRRDHIAHNVAVVVFARPDVAALRLHHTRYRVVDQRIEVGDACFFKSIRIFCVKDFLHDILEGMVIFFGNGILGGKPEILFCIQRIGKAASRKALDGAGEVMHSLQHAASLKFMDQLARFVSVFIGKYKLRFSCSRNLHLRCLVNIAVGMSCDRDRLFPGAHVRLDALYDDRRAKNGAVENRSDGSVRTLPHLF